MRFLGVLLLWIPALVVSQELLLANSQLPVTSANPQDSRDWGSNAVSSIQNVTGTYKGSWRRLQHDTQQPWHPLLDKQTGALFYRFNTIASGVRGVHNIEGEMVIRDGDLHSEDDLTLHVSGVYILDSRRVHAALQPTSAFGRLPLQPQDAKERTAAYRQALRDLAEDWVQVSQAWEGGSEDDIIQELQPMTKQCEFVLEFGVKPSQRSQSGAISLSQALAGEASSTLVEDEDGEEGSLIMNGTIHSNACGLALELQAASTRLDVYYTKAIRYTLTITAVSFLQILLLLQQMEVTNTPQLLSKISMLTIGQQAIMDAYLCLLHLTTGIMVDPLFNSFATAAFLEFIIFAIFEMRYLLMIWRVQRNSSMDPWTQQRELSILYARFYSALLGGIFVSYQMQRWMQLIVLACFSYWIPQIVLCAYQDVRQPLKAQYVVGMSLTRLVLPLYLYGCPQNLLRNPISSTMCIVLPLYMLCQVVLLLGQSYLGPRFFIPKMFLPPKYDYFRVDLTRLGGPEGGSDIETGDAGAECVICMNPVDVMTAQARMLTPCNHVFHPACLQRWMDIKMECPTCRAPLPMV